jgi:hypothetical protein
MVARICRSDRGVDPCACANTFTAILQTRPPRIRYCLRKLFGKLSILMTARGPQCDLFRASRYRRTAAGDQNVVAR